MTTRLASLGRAALPAALLALAAACSADTATAPAAPAAPAAPVAALAAADGRYDLRLVSPNQQDAGALLVITGAAVDSVTAAGVEAILLPGEGATRVVLSGTLNGGLVATVWTRPGSGVPAAAVEQVTAAGTHAQRAVDGYRVELAR
jgi:hypothetical protein